MPNKSFTFRLPKETIERLDWIAKFYGVSRTTALNIAVTNAFSALGGFDNPDRAPLFQPDKHAQEVTP